MNKTELLNLTSESTKDIEFLSSRIVGELLNEKLHDIEDVKAYCKEHKLCYNNVIDIKNNKTVIRYPKLSKKLLFLLHNIDAEITPVFELNKKP